MCCPFLPSHCCKFLLRYYPLTVRPVLDLSPSSRMESVQGGYPPEVSLKGVHPISYTLTVNCSTNLPRETSTNRNSHGVVRAETLDRDVGMTQSRSIFQDRGRRKDCMALIRSDSRMPARQAFAPFTKPIEYGNRVSIFDFDRLSAAPTFFVRPSVLRTPVDMGNRA